MSCTSLQIQCKLNNYQVKSHLVLYSIMFIPWKYVFLYFVRHACGDKHGTMLW